MANPDIDRMTHEAMAAFCGCSVEEFEQLARDVSALSMVPIERARRSLVEAANAYASGDEFSPAERAEFEAARLDPTSDRARWDLFGPDADGGLERPGDGDEW